MNSPPKILRTNRRTFGLEISQSGELIVRAPKHASDRAIARLLESNQPWIKKKLTLVRERNAQLKPKIYKNGDTFLFLGKEYELFVTDRKGAPLVFEKGFNMAHKHFPRAEYHFIKWYKDQARLHFKDRVEHFAQKHDFTYEKIKLSSAQKRWGSCSHKNNLNFCWRLIMAPEEIIDYVVVHELSHTIHKDHSPRFWNHVESILPQFRTHKKWLQDQGHTMTL